MTRRNWFELLAAAVLAKPAAAVEEFVPKFVPWFEKEPGSLGPLPPGCVCEMLPTMYFISAKGLAEFPGPYFPGKVIPVDVMPAAEVVHGPRCPQWKREQFNKLRVEIDRAKWPGAK